MSSQPSAPDELASQRVVVVSNQSRLNGVLETVLDAGQYDVVFVESTEHAYSHIKRLAPHLILVCLSIDDVDGFQVLSMLKLDKDTRDIPLVTCTISDEPEDSSEDDDNVFGIGRSTEKLPLSEKN